MLPVWSGGKQLRFLVDGQNGSHLGQSNDENETHSQVSFVRSSRLPASTVSPLENTQTRSRRVALLQTDANCARRLGTRTFSCGISRRADTGTRKRRTCLALLLIFFCRLEGPMIFKGHEGNVSSCITSTDGIRFPEANKNDFAIWLDIGSMIVSASFDESIIVWDTNTAREKLKLKASHSHQSIIF